MAGLSVPDAGPVFVPALAVHVAAGLTAVTAGVLATTAAKRAGRHTRAGRVYVVALGVVLATASLMAVLRWHEDRHLFVVASTAAVLGLAGWRCRPGRARARPGRRPGPARARGRRIGWHAWPMAGSFMALLTGFYVDNGPRLPVWDRLPALSYWLLPSAVGIPLTWWALRRRRRPGR
jgi:hypothetical protein